MDVKKQCPSENILQKLNKVESIPFDLSLVLFCQIKALASMKTRTNNGSYTHCNMGT